MQQAKNPFFASVNKKHYGYGIPARPSISFLAFIRHISEHDALGDLFNHPTWLDTT